MVVTPRDFTQHERNIFIFCLKRRMDSLEEMNKDFLSNSKSWKNLYYYPVLVSKLKLEENKQKLLTKSEKLAMISCINEEITNKKNTEIVDKNLLEELFIIYRKIEK